MRFSKAASARADTTGTETRNVRLSGDRADRVASELRARGVPPEALRTRGEGSLFVPEQVACAGDRRGTECARRVDLKLGADPPGGFAR